MNVTTLKPDANFYNISQLPSSPQEKVSDYIVIGQWIGVVFLNLLSALFSGLVLGLLTLDVTDLEILRKCGTERERHYAATIIPMRRMSNLLLCSLTLANVIVNAVLQELLDRLFPGFVGIISTTACITVFGEILPQAICSRYGLAIGARTVWITFFVIAITSPVAYPLSLILDYLLGDEIAFVYDRERLQEYLRITKNYNNLDPQEINIINGALKIKKITAGQVMTKLKDVYMLDILTLINYQTVQAIVKRGFSRIPVYEACRQNVVGLLLIKDLALVNPFNETTLKSLITFYKHPIMSVDESHTIDLVFNHFREGRTHMALVYEHKRQEIIGVMTLEDIIEEVLQVEIIDETDIVIDNRLMRVRPDAQIPKNLQDLHPHLNEAMARRRARREIPRQPPFNQNDVETISPKIDIATRANKLLKIQHQIKQTLARGSKRVSPIIFRPLVAETPCDHKDANKTLKTIRKNKTHRRSISK